VVSPRRAAEQRVVLVGATASIGPGRSKDKRTFGRRSQVEPPGTSKEGAARWEATPELVSQDRERVHWGLRVFRGPGYEYRQILRSAQWGLAAMPAPISFGPRRKAGRAAKPRLKRNAAAPSTSLPPAARSARNSAGHPTIRPITREHSTPRVDKADKPQGTPNAPSRVGGSGGVGSGSPSAALTLAGRRRQSGCRSGTRWS
jgi:hypothetical protein